MSPSSERPSDAHVNRGHSALPRAQRGGGVRRRLSYSANAHRSPRLRAAGNSTSTQRPSLPSVRGLSPSNVTSDSTQPSRHPNQPAPKPNSSNEEIVRPVANNSYASLPPPSAQQYVVPPHKRMRTPPQTQVDMLLNRQDETMLASQPDTASPTSQYRPTSAIRDGPSRAALNWASEQPPPSNNRRYTVNRMRRPLSSASFSSSSRSVSTTDLPPQIEALSDAYLESPEAAKGPKGRTEVWLQSSRPADRSDAQHPGRPTPTRGPARHRPYRNRSLPYPPSTTKIGAPQQWERGTTTTFRNSDAAKGQHAPKTPSPLNTSEATRVAYQPTPSDNTRSYSFSEAAYSQSGNESSSSVNRRNTSIIDTPYRALSARASTMGTETSPRGGAFLPKDSARAAAAWDADEAQYQQIAAKLPRIDDDDEIVSAEEDLVARVVDFATQGVPSGHASPQDSADEAEWQESARLDGVAHEHRSPARRAAERQFAHMADEEDPLGPDEEAPENESPEQATQRQTRMLARLVTKDLVWGHGCGKKEHLIADEAHRAIFETGGIAHTHISKTYTTATPLQPPKDSDTPGLHNQQDIASVGDVSVPGVNDRTLQQSMEGALGGQDQRPPRHICVHSDDNRNTKGQNVWDIDSWIALPRTFSSLKAGIECKRYSRLPDIISSDLHIRTLAYRQDRPVSEEPRYIPHLHIGNLRSVDHVSVYMFFPHMELEHRVFNGLTEVDTAMFFDDLFFPSADVPPDVAQHFAQGHAAVKMNSLARAKESNNTGVTGSAVGERSLLGIESMKDMDTRMQDRIKNNPALTKFKEFYLFIDAKNIKTAHKHSHSLYHSMDAFEAHIKTHLDLHAMEEIYFDIGKEFTPAICKSAGAIFDEVPADPRAHVFLHKTCCLMSTKKTFVEKAFGSSPGIAVKWTHSFLRDVGGLNLTPPKRSPAYRKGLRYSQWYNVYKELFDAQKTFPFQHKQFTQLAKGNLVQTMVAQGNGGNTKIAAALSASYQHSRLRVANSLVKSQDKPYGARVEHRVGLKLFWAIKDEAEKIHNAECDCLHTNDDGSSSPAGSMFADIRLSRLDINTPSSLWAIPSATYMAFLAGNFDKLLRAYETGIRTADQYVSKERCKVLWVLLVALSHFQSADTKRPSVLWPNEQESAAAKQRRKKKGKTKGNPSRREVGESTLPFQDVDEVLDTETDDTHEALSHGLGLAENIEKYGYGWFLPRIDWKEWKILPEYEKTFLAFFADSQKGKGGHLNVARDNLDVIRMYGKLWPEYKGHPYAQEIIVECMALAVLRQYRFDIVQHLRKSNNPPNSTLEMEDYDSIKFSWDNVKTSFLKRHVVVRSGGQVHARDQKTMILWLFGPGLQANITVNGRPVELRRKNFVESPFRVAYDLVRKILFGFVAPAAFDHYFREIFFRYHWVVPYPDAGGSLSGTGKSDMGYARRWWVASPHDEFLTDHPRSGLPPPPPKYSEYDEVELRKKLNSKKLKSLGKPKRD